MPDTADAVLRPSRLFRALETFLLTAAAQATIQVLGFIGGLIVLRWLPVSQYAYYTIANSILGTISVLSDVGAAQSVMAQGAKVWQSRARLGAVMATGLALRRRLALIALTVSMPILFLSLRRQGATPATALLVAVSILPLFVNSLTGQMLQIALQLHQRLAPLQTTLLFAALLRVALIAIVVALYPVAWLAGLCAGAAQLWTNWRLRRQVEQFVDLTAAPDAAVRTATVRQMRRSAPGAIYYAFEAQISVWLIAIFGRTQAIAQVGALGRLAMGFGIVTSVISLLWVPRFARKQPGPAILRHFWAAQLTILTFVAATVAVVALFPGAALRLLGPSYATLRHEVILAVAGGGCSMMAGCAYLMAAARGVVISPSILLPTALLLQLGLIVSLPISTVSGVLWLSILANAALWCMHALNFTLLTRAGR
jgi:hypothetical protein